MKKLAGVATFSCLLVVLAGCSVGPAAGPPSATGAPSIASQAPTPAPTVTVTSDDRELTPESELTALIVYALCKSQTLVQVLSPGTNPEDYEWASFEESRTEQHNGVWSTMIGRPGAGENGGPGAIFCKVSGTIGDPVWNEFGVSFTPPSEEMWNDLVAVGGA